VPTGDRSHRVTSPYHSCSCGAISDPVNHVLPDGTLTNSLCVHYVAYHRHEVSAFELGYARQLSEDGVVPTSDELHGPEVSGRRSIVFGGGIGGGSWSDGCNGGVASARWPSSLGSAM
jgi:hypothetical protein